MIYFIGVVSSANDCTGNEPPTALAISVQGFKDGRYSTKGEFWLESPFNIPDPAPEYISICTHLKYYRNYGNPNQITPILGMNLDIGFFGIVFLHQSNLHQINKNIS